MDQEKPEEVIEQTEDTQAAPPKQEGSSKTETTNESPKISEFFIGILVVIVISLLVLIGFFVMKDDGEEEEQTKEQPQVTSTVEPTEESIPTLEPTSIPTEVQEGPTTTPEPTPDPYTGWETHEDQNLGLNFKHPGLYEIDSGTSVVNLRNSVNGTALISIQNTKPDYFFGTSTETPEEYIISDSTGKELPVESFVNGDGGPGYFSSTVYHLYELGPNLYATLTTFSQETSTYCNNGSGIDPDYCESEPLCTNGCEGFEKEIISETKTPEEDIDNAKKVILSIETN